MSDDAPQLKVQALAEAFAQAGAAGVSAETAKDSSKLIEIASFLDRIDRACEPTRNGSKSAIGDYRLDAFKRALEVLSSDELDKARAVQMIFSDPTTEPLESARGVKGASGAYKGGSSR